MIDAKKTFIVLINSKDCGDYFRIIDSAEEILKNNNIPYFYTYESDSSTYDFNGDVNALSEDGKGNNIYAKEYEVFQIIFS